MSEHCIIGRQPILDRNEHLYGYELLFRSTEANSAVFLDNDRATANVIINTLSSFGIVELLGGRKGFINVDFDMLMDDALELLPQDHIVIELLETIEPTPALIERCISLKEAGFSLALDDHQYHPNFLELYSIVDIVKIDLLQTPVESLPGLVKLLRQFPCKLLAEKVETFDLFKTCHALGFDYFQGYYFARPDVIKKKKMDADATTLLRLLRLLAEEAGIQELEDAFRNSPTLTYKLLMLVNSVAFGQRQKIQGVRHAIAMTGILSLLENIYDISVEEIITNLNLNEEVAAALLARKGDYGNLLRIMEYLEELDMSSATDQLTSIGINPNVMSEIQLRAFNWRKPG